VSSKQAGLDGDRGDPLGGPVLAGTLPFVLLLVAYDGFT
jgi:hypothetical protein